LEAEVAQLKKDSSTSSKPPSSDIVKPLRPPARGGKRGKRRAGGQPRHPRHVRPPFPPEQVDRFLDYEWETVPTGWKPLDRFHIIQQVELVEKPYTVTEHRARLYQNLRTGQVLAASLPAEVLNRYLGKAFDGIIPPAAGDYFSAYRKFLRETDVGLQLCWAHLIRDVKYLTTLLNRATRGYGHRLLGKIKTLFRIWHRRERTPAPWWERAAADARREVLAVARRAPTTSEARNLAKRFRDHGEEYFTFLDTPNVEPTNNGTERQIRSLAIDRKITQGTRGESGRRWCERIWTMRATCAQQGRSAFEFLYHSIIAHFTNQPFPSLLPLPP
jgi:hypothetical protein